MFSSVLALSALASTVSGVCLPFVWSAERHAWFSEKAVFEFRQEYYDFYKGFFKEIERYTYNGPTGPAQGADELIINATAGKGWRISRQGNSITCRAVPLPAKFVLPKPCLEPNATLARSDLILGGDVLTQDWHEDFYASQFKTQLYSHWHLTAATNIPVQVNRFWKDGAGLFEHESATYWNVQSGIPSDAYDIPSFCPPAEEHVNGPIPQETLENSRSFLSTVFRGQNLQ